MPTQVQSPDIDVYFSHSEPAKVALSGKSNAWSPSQWLSKSVAHQSPELKPEALPTMERWSLTVFFATDDDQLTAPEKARLVTFLQSIPTPQSRQFEVRGHTDSQHSVDYNQGLSERRARAVSQWLRRQGVQGNHIRVRGLGLHQPQSTNATVAGRAQNRRVEVQVLVDAPE